MSFERRLLISTMKNTWDTLYSFENCLLIYHVNHVRSTVEDAHHQICKCQTPQNIIWTCSHTFVPWNQKAFSSNWDHLLSIWSKKINKNGSGKVNFFLSFLTENYPNHNRIQRNWSYKQPTKNNNPYHY